MLVRLTDIVDPCRASGYQKTRFEAIAPNPHALRRILPPFTIHHSRRKSFQSLLLLLLSFHQCIQGQGTAYPWVVQQAESLHVSPSISRVAQPTWPQFEPVRARTVTLEHPQVRKLQSSYTCLLVNSPSSQFSQLVQPLYLSTPVLAVTLNSKTACSVLDAEERM